MLARTLHTRIGGRRTRRRRDRYNRGGGGGYKYIIQKYLTEVFRVYVWGGGENIEKP